MSNGRNSRGQQQQARRKQIDWFQSSDESVATVANWDLKIEALASAVVQVLAAGDAIMFGVSLAGDAISVTIYSGESKSRKWVSDSIELDDLMATIAQRGRQRNAGEKGTHLEVVAD
jgi:hypothetical protein